MNKLIVTGLGSTSCWQLGVAVSLLKLHFMDSVLDVCYLLSFEALSDAQKGLVSYHQWA